MACDDHMDKYGDILHEVWEVHLRNVAFRVCARCRLALLIAVLFHGCSEMEIRQAFGVLGSALNDDIRKRMAKEVAKGTPHPGHNPDGA
jgi:hypothetical protein